MQYKLIETTLEDRILSISLNRPEKRNALSAEMVTELKQALRNAEENPEVKIVLLKGKGGVFSAGTDLESLQKLQTNTYDENLADSNHLKELFRTIYNYPKVIVSQVEGHAIAGGCGLATVTDFCFAIEEAQFGYTEVKIGFVPAIVMIFLIRKIGEGKARELLLSSKLIRSEEAAEIGLINSVIPKEEIESYVMNFCKGLCTGASAHSLRITKAMISAVQNMKDFEALDFAAEMNAEARSSADCKRGIAAFINKEKLVW